MRQRVRVRVLHRYYKMTHFYSFLAKLALKAVVILGAAVLAIWLINRFVVDLEALLENLVNNFPQVAVLAIFLVSETVLGLIPPELFIAWSAKTELPWVYLTAIALLSYLGGILAYGIGQRIYRIRSVRNDLRKKVSDHIYRLRKWGAFLIVIGAMLPLPHAIVSLSCGLIGYPFRRYLLWALFRILRFFLYAIPIFKAI